MLALVDAWRATRSVRTSGPVPVMIGTTVAGRPLVVPVGLSGLVAGVPGSGKSVTLRAIGWAAARAGAAVLAIDPKAGVELDQIPTAAPVATTHRAALDLLAEVDAVLTQRLDTMRMTGARHYDGRPVVVIVDELAQIVDAGDDLDGPSVRRLLRLVAVGRAAGIAVTMATQRPSSDTIPTRLRDLTGWRIAHAVATATDSRMILGTHNGPGAETLPMGRPGQAFAVVDGATRSPIRCRVFPPCEASMPVVEELLLPSMIPPATTADDALTAALDAGPLTVPALARAVGRPVSSVRRDLDRMAAAGIVHRRNGSYWDRTHEDDDGA